MREKKINLGSGSNREILGDSEWQMTLCGAVRVGEVVDLTGRVAGTSRAVGVLDLQLQSWTHYSIRD